MFQVSSNLLISRDKASSTMMKSSGLSTEPWCTPNFNAKSSLRPLQHSSVHSCKFHNPFLSPTPSFLIANQITGTWSDVSRSTKTISICLPTVRNFSSCSWYMTTIASVVPLPLPGKNPNCYSSIVTTCLMRLSANLSRKPTSGLGAVRNPR